MAKMLGNTPYRTHSVCKGCGRKPPEDVLYRRNQRSRERAEVRKMMYDMEGDPKLVLGSDC